MKLYLTKSDLDYLGIENTLSDSESVEYVAATEDYPDLLKKEVRAILGLDNK